jgi:predicted transcriptional regulator
MDDHTPELLDMTVGIVANYVARNSIGPEEVAALIASTYAALRAVNEPKGEPVEVYERPTATQVRKSISDAGLVSFIDGKTYQSLRRHLTIHGMSPTDYRDRYGLQESYPMVSPAYSARRSTLAKASGLGQGGRKPKRVAPSKT